MVGIVFVCITLLFLVVDLPGRLNKKIYDEKSQMSQIILAELSGEDALAPWVTKCGNA